MLILSQSHNSYRFHNVQWKLQCVVYPVIVRKWGEPMRWSMLAWIQKQITIIFSHIYFCLYFVLFVVFSSTIRTSTSLCHLNWLGAGPLVLFDVPANRTILPVKSDVVQQIRTTVFALTHQSLDHIHWEEGNWCVICVVTVLSQPHVSRFRNCNLFRTPIITTTTQSTGDCRISCHKQVRIVNNDLNNYQSGTIVERREYNLVLTCDNFGICTHITITAITTQITHSQATNNTH